MRRRVPPPIPKVEPRDPLVWLYTPGTNGPGLDIPPPPIRITVGDNADIPPPPVRVAVPPPPLPVEQPVVDEVAGVELPPPEPPAAGGSGGSLRAILSTASRTLRGRLSTSSAVRGVRPWFGSPLSRTYFCAAAS